MLCKNCNCDCHHDITGGEHKIINDCDCKDCKCGKIKKDNHLMLWHFYHSILAFLLGCMVIIELIELIKDW